MKLMTFHYYTRTEWHNYEIASILYIDEVLTHLEVHGLDFYGWFPSAN